MTNTPTSDQPEYLSQTETESYVTLTDQELDRLADIVRLQPMKNSELEDAWGLESGSELYSHIQSHLSDYYLRDDNNLIRATSDAAELVNVDPGIEGENEGTPNVSHVPQV